MARKIENDQALSAKTLAHIKSLRSQIDKFDLQILKLVNERADSAGEIGKLKKNGETMNLADSALPSGTSVGRRGQ